MAGLRQQVISRLQRGLSPDQVTGRLTFDLGRTVRSHECIYRFIYAQIRRTKNYNWCRLLPRGKSKRGRRGRRGSRPASFIQYRLPLSHRPEDANDRRTPGH